MAYVVTDNCIRCKYMDCVQVCPVDCFREGVEMLVIDPDECIDCGVCEPECPADAIRAADQADDTWLALNTRLAGQWPSVTAKGSPPDDADRWKDVPGKLEQLDETAAMR